MGLGGVESRGVLVEVPCPDPDRYAEADVIPQHIGGPAAAGGLIVEGLQQQGL